MTLEDHVEAYLVGELPEVPPELRADFERAVAGYDAIQFAIGETISVPEEDIVDREPPQLPDDYEIVREIGRGGMGVVYLARQRSLGRDIAVKVLRPGESLFGPLVKRFMEEARHLARLRHPNIVSVHSVSQAAEEPYFTMDFVPGRSLSTLLSQEQLSPSQAVAILKQVADGVRHAHEQGIIHRDLKPANVLVGESGHTYVTDFGLARDVTQDSNLTRSGEIMGTPAYMSPEQALGQAELIGEATDVHALGAILYEMLTRRPPYGNDAPAKVLVRLLNEDPVAPRQIDRRIPRDLETICLKAMAKVPERRYQNVRSMVEDLRRYESGEPVLARRPGPIHHAVRFLGRQWKIASAVLLTTILLLSIAPRLFDKSVEELRAWGDERHLAGDHSGAVSVYRRALRTATGSERTAILQSMIRCAREIGDVNGAVEAARQILDVDSDASFGELDYLVAQALITELRASNTNHTLRDAAKEHRPILELAARRWQKFLDGSEGTTEQREEARKILAQVQDALYSEPLLAMPSDESFRELPRGTIDELLARAADSNLNPWQRGKANYAAGLELEKEGPAERAGEAFKTAFEQMRSVFPIYEGIKGMMTAGQQPDFPDTPECRLLRETFGSLRRVDPASPNPLTGGIRFHIQGVKIPEGLRVGVQVTLCDPEIKDPDRAFHDPSGRLPDRTVTVQPDQTAWIGVADGRYRLEASGRRMTYEGDEATRMARLMELDYRALPQEIEIHGNVLELEIPAWVLREIDLATPEAGGSMDLTEDFFRWSEIEDAACYRVDFGYIGDEHTFFGLGSVQVGPPRLCLGTSQDKAALRVGQKLRTGRTGTWYVSAYDADGRKIATSMELNRPFLVTRDLNAR